VIERLPGGKQNLGDIVCAVKKLLTLVLILQCVLLAGDRDKKERIHRVGGSVTAPVPVKQIPPAVPHPIKKFGSVTLIAVVGTDGIPRDIKAASAAPKDLAEAGAAALAGWRFKPATKNGEPVAVRIAVEIDFREGSPSDQPQQAP
jgi:hypothetical protein